MSIRLATLVSLLSLVAAAGCLAPGAQETGSAGIHEPDPCIPGDPENGCPRGEECIPTACAFWCPVDDPDCCPDTGWCEPIEEQCPPVMCMLWCPGGLERGEDGCEICECEEDKPSCEDLGGICAVSPFDPGFSADCEDELDMDTADGTCPAFNQSCCVPREPVERGCGGRLGLTCDEDEYCAYAPEEMCGAADHLGVCTRRPEACIQVWDPVCGCDGETYGNACGAAAAGTSVAHDGACAPIPVDCRQEGCADGRTCSFCWGGWACIPDGAVC